MQPTVLITGGTGTLGRELVKRLLEDPRSPRVFVLSRTGAERLAHDGSAATVQMVRGDICAGPDLGLPRRTCDALTEAVTAVLHCAASTSFTLPLDEARAINVGGTRAVLRFAARCRSLRQVACFSTVYVAGRRTGTFREDDLDSGGAGFVNSYEQSKHEMEQAVRSMMADLPIAVYRLSTLIGDSRSGAVHGFNAFHHALRLLYQGLVPMVPGDARHKVDLVPVDYVADAASWLLRHNFVAGRTYHFCSGPARSAALGELVDAALEAFSEYRPAWRKRGIERPVIADLRTYELFVRSVDETGNEALQRATRAVQAVAYQLAYPKAFDTARTEADLAGSGLSVPGILEYYSKVIRYCLDTDWGAAAR